MVAVLVVTGTEVVMVATVEVVDVVVCKIIIKEFTPVTFLHSAI